MNVFEYISLPQRFSYAHQKAQCLLVKKKLRQRLKKRFLSFFFYTEVSFWSLGFFSVKKWQP